MNSIDFSIGGNNSKLEIVLKDSEKKAKEAAKKITNALNDNSSGGDEKKSRALDKVLSSERSVKRHIGELSGVLLSGASASDKFAASVVHLGETFRIGLAAGVGIAIGEGIKGQIEKATEALNEFSEKWKEMLEFNSSKASEGDFAGQFKRAQDQLEKATSGREYLEGIEKTPGIGTIAQFIPQFNQAKELYSAGEESAAKETNRMAGIEKKFGKADEILSDAEAKKANYETIAAERPNVTAHGEARDKLVGQFFNLQRISEAKTMKSQAVPENKKMAQEAFLAEREASKAKAEIFNYDEKIAREEKKQVDSVNASLAATKARLSGNQLLATTIERQAKSADAIKSAEQAGNLELAGRLREMEKVNAMAEKFNRLVDPNTGSLRSAASILSDTHHRSRVAKNMEKSQRRFNETGGLLNVTRNLHGNVVSGIDPDTGKIMERNARSGAVSAPESPADRWKRIKAGMTDDLGPLSASLTKENSKNSSKELSEIKKTMDEIASVITAWKN